LLATARNVMLGTMDYLVDGSHHLRPCTPGDEPQGGDADYYWTGIAVFMRYLLYVYQNNTDLKNSLQYSDTHDFIRANADYVATTPNRQQSSDPVVNYANDLAVLVAAIGMLTS
jgi:hypothetical protein